MNNPSAEQKKWMGTVAAIGCIVTGSSACQIHHPFGRTASVKGVGNLGHWLIIGLHPLSHAQIDQGKLGLQTLKDDSDTMRGDGDKTKDMSLHELEKYLYGILLRRIGKENRPDGLTSEIINAISEYRR